LASLYVLLVFSWCSLCVAFTASTPARRPTAGGAPTPAPWTSQSPYAALCSQSSHPTEQGFLEVQHPLIVNVFCTHCSQPGVLSRLFALSNPRTYRTLGTPGAVFRRPPTFMRRSPPLGAKPHQMLYPSIPFHSEAVIGTTAYFLQRPGHVRLRDDGPASQRDCTARRIPAGAQPQHQGTRQGQWTEPGPRRVGQWRRHCGRPAACSRHWRCVSDRQQLLVSVPMSRCGSEKVLLRRVKGRGCWACSSIRLTFHNLHRTTVCAWVGVGRRRAGATRAARTLRIGEVLGNPTSDHRSSPPRFPRCAKMRHPPPPPLGLSLCVEEATLAGGGGAGGARSPGPRRSVEGKRAAGQVSRAAGVLPRGQRLDPAARSAASEADLK
jgi:hypothetical protein